MTEQNEKNRIAEITTLVLTGLLLLDIGAPDSETLNTTKGMLEKASPLSYCKYSSYLKKIDEISL